MSSSYNRRRFLQAAASTAIGLSAIQSMPVFASNKKPEGKRIGIIGLDTSHSIDFTKYFNDLNAVPEMGGYRVVAAYPKGSNDIASAVNRIPGYIEEIKKLGVEVVDSIPALLSKSDVVMLETNDGRLHLEQAMQVFRAGKTVFIDKPISASLSDAMAIFEAAEKYKVPVFSSSSLRYMASLKPIVNGKIGKVLGADTYSPATIEKTHPDFFWYGIHGVETLYTIMGTGCQKLVRVHTEDTDVVVGTWKDGRVGSFRGTRSGQHLYGGTVYGELENAVVGPLESPLPLLIEIVKFFQTGKSPVPKEETLEICAFMEAADESKRRGGAEVILDDIWKRAAAKKTG